MAGPGATFGLKMAPVWRVAGPGATFGLKMAPVWRVAGPGATFGLKMVPGMAQGRKIGESPVAYLLTWMQR